jgi:DNA-directed RNA polymerase sigma subunit (sigma70/sigma32)
MNPFEKCLLVDALVQLGNNKDAERIAEHIRLQKDVVEYTDVEQLNKVFDIVLNLNSGSDKSGGAAGGMDLLAAGALGGMA